MVLQMNIPQHQSLSAECQLQRAAIVREREATVLRWLKRYMAEGLNGFC
jgi:hypothetical protein